VDVRGLEMHPVRGPPRLGPRLSQLFHEFTAKKMPLNQSTSRVSQVQEKKQMQGQFSSDRNYPLLS
jgi:hypothetical protein